MSIGVFLKSAQQLKDDALGLKPHEGHSLFHLSTESWARCQQCQAAFHPLPSIAEQCMEPLDATNSVFKLTNNEEQRIYTLC